MPTSLDRVAQSRSGESRPRTRPGRGAFVAVGIILGLVFAAEVTMLRARPAGLELLPLMGPALAFRYAVGWLGGILAVAAICILLRFRRRGRAFLAVFAMLGLAAAGCNVGVQIQRGMSPMAIDRSKALGASDIRILSWNTNEGRVSPAELVSLIKKFKPQIVVLPEMFPVTYAYGYAKAIRGAGIDLSAYPPDNSTPKNLART